MKTHDPQAYHRLRTVPGIGKILALTILYEIHDIARIGRVRDFLTKCRLERCEHRSAGKRGKAKAMSLLAAKLGRTVYFMFMLSKEKAFDMERIFVKN